MLDLSSGVSPMRHVFRRLPRDGSGALCSPVGGGGRRHRQHAVVVDVTKEQLENTPGFDPENWPLPNDTGWVGDVYEYYGREPYWEAPLT